MSRTLSIFLDLLRCSAAIVVVFGHLTEGTFSSGLRDQTIYAVAAVSAFFVLSGFVISYVASTKEHDPVKYTVARLARLYSVLVPAIILSGLVLAVGLKLDPGFVSNWTTSDNNLGFLYHYPAARYLAQSLLPLTFLNSIHNHDAYPALNSPMWSIGFEAAYYALFGIALFTRGRLRIVLLLLSSLLFGTAILRLLPVWLGGVALHRLTLRLKPSRVHAILIGVPCLLALAAGCARWPAFESWSNQPHGELLSGLLHGKGRAEQAYLFYYWGTLTSLLVLAVASLQDWAGLLLIPIEKPVRWCAAHTFSLYLFHFPLLVLVFVLTHYNRASRLADAAAFVTVILLCVLLSSVSESKKFWWRDILLHTITRMRGHAAAIP